MSYTQGEYVDGGSNPSILLIEPIIQPILLPLYFLCEIVVLPKQCDQIGFELQ